MSIGGDKKKLSYIILSVTFVIYCILLGYTMSHHELWGDEIHSWNIAKSSGSFFDLISNTRYEGHPPVWYIILWTISKFTHDPTSIQIVHLLIACFVVFIILFFSPFLSLIKGLIPFGYFFLFEYAILSRNYAISLLFAFCICVLLHKHLKGKIFLYYVLLFLLSNTHFLALLLAASFHFYFLLSQKGEKKKVSQLVIHLIAGIIVLLPSAYFIFPPVDSSLGTNYWLDRWNFKQLIVITQQPIRAYVPIPAWWEHNFWDTQFLIASHSKFSILKWLTPAFSLAFILLSIYLLKKNKKGLSFFLINFLLVASASFVMSFTNLRHVGYIFIGFVIALWLQGYHQPISKKENRLITFLLVIQVIGGVIAITKDVKEPFSNANKASELLKLVPPNESIVTDYWCLNSLSAFTDKSFYCVDLKREASYLLWNAELNSALKSVDRYSNGLKSFLNTKSSNQVYMITIHSPQNLTRVDTSLPTFFNIRLVDKKEGAIEKGGNLYLYELTLL